MRSLLLRFLALTAIALLIYLNIQIWQLNWLSCVALAVYFWFASEYYQRILIERFSFQPGVRSKIIGGFFAMAVFGFLPAL